MFSEASLEAMLANIQRKAPEAVVGWFKSSNRTLDSNWVMYIPEIQGVFCMLHFSALVQ